MPPSTSDGVHRMPVLAQTGQPSSPPSPFNAIEQAGDTAVTVQHRQVRKETDTDQILQRFTIQRGATETIRPHISDKSGRQRTVTQKRSSRMIADRKPMLWLTPRI